MANIFLAIDPITGHDIADNTGLIAGMNIDAGRLRSAGFDAATYSTGNNRLQVVDDQTTNFDPNVGPGGYLFEGKMVRDKPRTAAEQVQWDINHFREVFSEKESIELPQLLSREKVDTVIDSGHSWVDDILHGWVKPWLRLVESQLRTEKASGTPDPTAYATDLAAFIRQATTPGLLGFHARAIRSEWRPLRNGLVVWEFDTADGGTLDNSNRNVAYPTDETVATWSAYAALQTL